MADGIGNPMAVTVSGIMPTSQPNAVKRLGPVKVAAQTVNESWGVRKASTLDLARKGSSVEKGKLIDIVF